MKGGAVLDEQKDIRFSLWKKRHTLPTIGKRKSITLLILIIAAAALLPGGAFGTFYMTVAGALLALLLTADRSLLWLASIPGVGIIAFLTHALFASDSASMLWILSAFLYIPIGLVLAACIYNRQGLTVTTTAVAVVFGILLILSAGIQLHLAYGDIREGAVILWERLQAGLTDMLSSIGFPGENGVLFVYTEKEIQSIIQSAVMLLPAMGILTCQLFAYLCAKIYRLLALSMGADFLFEKAKWPLTASAPAYIIFTVCYFISLFASEASVINYAAYNLLYIFLPVTAASGFHAMFDTKTSGKGRRQIPLMILCAVMFFISPIALLMLLAFWGAVRTFFTAVLKWMKKHSDPDD